MKSRFHRRLAWILLPGLILSTSLASSQTLMFRSLTEHPAVAQGTPPDSDPVLQMLGAGKTDVSCSMSDSSIVCAVHSQLAPITVYSVVVIKIKHVNAFGGYAWLLMKTILRKLGIE